MIALSERHANTTPLLTSLEQDQQLQATLLSGQVDRQKMEQAIAYVSDQYGCGETEAEEAVNHLLRQQVQLSEGRKAQRNFAYDVGDIVNGPFGRAKVLSITEPTNETKSGRIRLEQVDPWDEEIKPGYSYDSNTFQLRGIVQKRSGQANGKQIIIPPTIDDPIGKKVPVEKVVTPKTQPLTINAQPATTPDQKLQDVTKPLVKNENRQQGIIDSIKAVKVAVAELGERMYNLEMSEDNMGVVMEKIIESVSHAMADQTAKTVEQMASPLLSRG